MHKLKVYIKESIDSSRKGGGLLSNQIKNNCWLTVTMNISEILKIGSSQTATLEYKLFENELRTACNKISIRELRHVRLCENTAMISEEWLEFLDNSSIPLSESEPATAERDEKDAMWRLFVTI